ncbi:MAG: gliding motility lipoprotein GldD [Bacteroidetes bacterium]|nr:gliding motility lipoprotein GldD [Bacteroidota bacterium]
MMNKLILSLFILAIIAASCNEPNLPKQHGYPFIKFPEHEYEKWEISGVPYSFEKPKYTIMVVDTSSAFWYNLNFTLFDATLYFSYKTFNSNSQFDSLINDTRNLVYKHTIKATDIPETEIKDSSGNTGILYEIQGETATSCNFYLSDNKSKFFRGALYFNNYTTIDSVAPVIDFIKKDIRHIIKTFRFK